MQWVASTLHTTSEHGVFSITTADAHISAATSRLTDALADLNGLVHRPKDEIWFLRLCHHISTSLYHAVRTVSYTADLATSSAPEI